ncbi:LuxR C-terminal-related transcriptional regulator [Paraburkholderia sp. Cpub6]|uniref:LuxR C-terminal-related transcriptional regulator n=1 Tax=Paraburkholderia sp. Cpub6 TaxID=2723094 RepID=UPI001C86404D
MTRGERNILALVAQGLMNKQIASELYLSEITIKANRSNLVQRNESKVGRKAG